MMFSHLNKLASGMLILASSCTIEPPLHLAEAVTVEYGMPEVVTDITTIWDIHPDWYDQWWYGWDENDIRAFGTIDYPIPTNYEARIYFYGADKYAQFLSHDKQHLETERFTRSFPIGWHDLLIWSNIDSPSGLQTVRIDESNPAEIHATTSMTSVGYSRAGLHNHPEIFYAGMPERFHVSHDPADYDYYDAARKVYVKHLDAFLQPLVYTYLVQVVLYNNNSRATGTAEQSAITGLADGVNVHTGHTHSKDVAVIYDMRMKRQLPARNGRMADILGGKLTTFGLCDMASWGKSRGSIYTGSRLDLDNKLALNLQFSNSSDSVYVYNVTDQMRRQAHGGVITIEIDMDTLHIPNPGVHSNGSIFDPIIAPTDSVTHEFDF